MNRHVNGKGRRYGAGYSVCPFPGNMCQGGGYTLPPLDIYFSKAEGRIKIYSENKDFFIVKSGQVKLLGLFRLCLFFYSYAYVNKRNTPISDN